LFEGPKDLLYFLNWESIPVAVGTFVLAILELNVLSPDWAIATFVDDWKWTVLTVAIAAILLPPIFAKGTLHLRSRQRAGEMSAETAWILRGVQSRASNLILKFREAFAGEASSQYQAHLMEECKSYFETRASRQPDGKSRQIQVEVAYYAVDRRSRSTLLSRKKFTQTDPSRGRPNFSSNGNAEAKLAVETIVSGHVVFCADVHDSIDAAVLKIEDGPSRQYRSLLSVPIFRDRKSSEDERVIGMLSATSSHTDSIFESDQAILQTYAWFLAAAIDADSLAKSSKRSA